METTLTTNIINFASYFGLSLVLLVIFKYIYAFVTPHDEWKLIKEDQNSAAAIGLGGAVVGFAIALGGAASNSVSWGDFLTWGVIALAAQILAFAVVRFVFMPKIVARIEAGEISAGIMLAASNLAVGLMNAACMTY
jgi:putative membrane protein